MIYTSYFAKANRLPNNVIPIAICAKAPEGYKGLQYKKLAPSYSILMEWKANHNEDLYIRRFSEEILSRLSFDEVMRDIAQMTPDGADCCLLCYEKSSDFCHRHLVADWLNEHGVDCHEFDFNKTKELE